MQNRHHLPGQPEPRGIARTLFGAVDWVLGFWLWSPVLDILIGVVSLIAESVLWVVEFAIEFVIGMLFPE